MATPCNAKNGCGSVSWQPKQTDNQNINLVPAPVITYPQMTNCMNQNLTATAQANAMQNTPSFSGMVASTVPMPGTEQAASSAEISFLPASEEFETIPGQPDPPALFANVESGRTAPSSANQTAPSSSGSNSAAPEPILPEAPQFQVPNNPLLPPGYQETINYENLQYLNGFLRTQIGKYLRVEQLVGSSNIEDRYGYLIGVGINYILLQELGTGNVSAIDYYNIKYVYIYFATPELPYFK